MKWGRTAALRLGVPPPVATGASHPHGGRWQIQSDDTGNGGAYRTKIDATTLTRQQQFENLTLVRSDGNCLAAKHGAAANIVYGFTFDDRQQLTSQNISYSGLSDATWSYDTAGNRLSSVDTHGSQGYEVNNLNQIDPSAPGVQFVWDVDGNLDADPEWDYAYDGNNRLIMMVSKSGNPAHPMRLEFIYDYLGRRVRKKVFPNTAGTSGTETVDLKYVYNGMELLAELNSSGAIRKSFHWGVDRSDTRSGAGGVEGLLMIHDWVEGKALLPSYDMNGNVVGLLNAATGAWEAWYAYDAFGNILKEGGAYKDKNPIRFSTKYTDEESGLVYYGFRFYDAKKGRFINRDPIEEAGGVNLYHIVGNDPANRWDYLGMDPPLSQVNGISHEEWRRMIEMWERMKSSTWIDSSGRQYYQDRDGTKYMFHWRPDGNGGSWLPTGISGGGFAYWVSPQAFNPGMSETPKVGTPVAIQGRFDEGARDNPAEKKLSWLCAQWRKLLDAARVRLNRDAGSVDPNSGNLLAIGLSGEGSVIVRFNGSIQVAVGIPEDGGLLDARAGWIGSYAPKKKNFESDVGVNAGLAFTWSPTASPENLRGESWTGGLSLEPYWQGVYIGGNVGNQPNGPSSVTFEIGAEIGLMPFEVHGGRERTAAGSFSVRDMVNTVINVNERLYKAVCGD